MRVETTNPVLAEIDQLNAAQNLGLSDPEILALYVIRSLKGYNNHQLVHRGKDLQFLVELFTMFDDGAQA